MHPDHPQLSSRFFFLFGEN